MATTTHLELSKINLFRALKAASRCMSKEPTRFHLNGILIEIKENKLRFVATNGHVLARLDVHTALQHHDASMILPDKAVKVLLANSKPTDKRDRDTLCTLEIDETGRLYVRTTTLHGAMCYGLGIDSKFPPYHEVVSIKLGVRETSVVGINPTYMKLIGEIGEDILGKNSPHGARILLDAPLEPIRVEMEDGDLITAILVIMPMRV